MLVAIRIMAMLGVRTIFLVGADFNMDSKKPYAFDQEKHDGGARSNNNAYKALNSFFNVLKPHFNAINLNVYNTNPDSGLKTFDHIPYEQAIEIALKDVGDPSKELTAGMYEQLKDKKKRARRAGKKTDPAMNQGAWDPNGHVLTPEGGPTASEQPAAKSDIQLAGKARLEHDDVLKARIHWVKIYPHLDEVLATLTKDMDPGILKLNEGCGGCRANKTPRTRKGRRARAAGLAVRAQLAVDYTKALFEAINADPAIMREHRTYRPDTMIQGAKTAFKLSQVVEGAEFDG